MRKYLCGLGLCFLIAGGTVCQAHEPAEVKDRFKNAADNHRDRFKNAADNHRDRMKKPVKK